MKVGIIGANGNVGRTLTKLVVKNEIFMKSLYLSDINDSWLSDGNDTTIRNSNVLFLCVKPKEIPSVLKQVTKNKLIVSPAALTSISDISKQIDESNKIIRIMPSLSNKYKKGIITYFPDSKVNSEDIENMEQLLDGPLLFKVKEEKLLDVSTFYACLPAFFSYLSEVYLEFGETNGFTKEESSLLYFETIKGTLKMMEDQTPEEIIKTVSSKGGVTEKAINYLKENRIKDTIKNSLETSSIVSKKN